MTKYILFDAENKLAARYDGEIHGDNIPDDAILVSDELFFQTINETDGIWSFVDGEIVKVALPDPVPPTIAELLDAKLIEINKSFETEMSALTSQYPASEMLSWSKQETEARAYILDDTAITPLLDSLAEARNIDKFELVNRVIVKADGFATFSGMTIGKRQGLEDAIEVLRASPDTTVEDVEAIQW